WCSAWARRRPPEECSTSPAAWAATPNIPVRQAASAARIVISRCDAMQDPGQWHGTCSGAALVTPYPCRLYKVHRRIALCGLSIALASCKSPPTREQLMPAAADVPDAACAQPFEPGVIPRGAT